jgi:hypothetical protein
MQTKCFELETNIFAEAADVIKRFNAECNVKISQLNLQHRLHLPIVDLENDQSSTFSTDFIPLLTAIQSTKSQNNLFEHLRSEFEVIYDKFIVKLNHMPVHLLFAAFSNETGPNIDLFYKLKCEMVERDELVEFIKEQRNSEEFLALINECGHYLSFYMQVIHYCFCFYYVVF